MKLVINHLTRMAPGYICVAGIDSDLPRHVRPVIRGRLSRRLLLEEGGIFDVGTEVDLGPTQPAGHAPETEDHLFNPQKARSIRKLEHHEFWEAISKLARPSLNEIFGNDLERQDHGFATSLGKGVASLGCLHLTEAPDLTTTQFDGKSKVRINIVDQGGAAQLSVTDIRLYESDQTTPKFSLITRIAHALRGGEEAILCVGLARSWTKPGDTEARHWLQLNNVHLKNHPF